MWVFCFITILQTYEMHDKKKQFFEIFSYMLFIAVWDSGRFWNWPFACKLYIQWTSGTRETDKCRRESGNYHHLDLTFVKDEVDPSQYDHVVLTSLLYHLAESSFSSFYHSPFLQNNNNKENYIFYFHSLMTPAYINVKKCIHYMTFFSQNNDISFLFDFY